MVFSKQFSNIGTNLKKLNIEDTVCDNFIVSWRRHKRLETIKL